MRNQDLTVRPWEEGQNRVSHGKTVWVERSDLISGYIAQETADYEIDGEKKIFVKCGSKENWLNKFYQQGFAV